MFNQNFLATDCLRSGPNLDVIVHIVTVGASQFSRKQSSRARGLHDRSCHSQTILHLPSIFSPTGKPLVYLRSLRLTGTRFSPSTGARHGTRPGLLILHSLWTNHMNRIGSIEPGRAAHAECSKHTSTAKVRPNKNLRSAQQVSCPPASSPAPEENGVLQIHLSSLRLQ